VNLWSESNPGAICSLLQSSYLWTYTDCIVQKWTQMTVWRLREMARCDKCWISSMPSVISGLRRIMDKIFALLGCCATLISSEFPTFRDNLSVPSPRVKQSKTIRYIFVFAENCVGEELTPTRPGPIRIPNCTLTIGKSKGHPATGRGGPRGSG